MKHEVLMTGPMYPPTIAELEQAYTVHKLWSAPDPASLIASVAERVTAIASSNSARLDGPLMEKLPKLKTIAHFGVGYDAVDVDAARKRGIAVTNTPDVLTEEVADLTVGLLLATIRRIPQGDRYVREGKWLKGSMALTDSLQGKTVGIIGIGRIGRAIARRLLAFNVTLAYQGPNRKMDVAWPHYPDPVSLAREVDIVIAACPGGEATRGLVSRAVIDAIGDKGYFVNISRGSVVDEPALLEALQQKRIAGAGLDVFADEPRVPEAFFALDNVVLQPHVASATHPTRKAMGQLVIDNLAAHFSGKPLLTPV
ncbi:MAG TPA: 2-hydroxyacid dehydrogenase [Usitatibacter sp.]|jgi:lactate dehydrogenase-like 2-hydroxyacid dehydrogenase|nr:2-hydroxyacid dehydrogenase [Usitatibacter sp.]